MTPAPTAVARIVPAARPLRSSQGRGTAVAACRATFVNHRVASYLPRRAVPSFRPDRAVETVLRQLLVECSNIDAKHLGGGVPVAVRTQQRALHVARFDIGQQLVQASARWSAAGSGR